MQHMTDPPKSPTPGFVWVIKQPARTVPGSYAAAARRFTQQTTTGRSLGSVPGPSNGL
jgi:hypothetical protein